MMWLPRRELCRGLLCGIMSNCLENGEVFATAARRPLNRPLSRSCNNTPPAVNAAPLVVVGQRTISASTFFAFSKLATVNNIEHQTVCRRQRFLPCGLSIHSSFLISANITQKMQHFYVTCKASYKAQDVTRNYILFLLYPIGTRGLFNDIHKQSMSSTALDAVVTAAAAAAAARIIQITSRMIDLWSLRQVKR